MVKKRKQKSFISSILTAAFVLFLLGLFAMISLQAEELSKSLKENIEVNAYIADYANEAEVMKVFDSIQEEAYCKRVTHITKQDALESFSEDVDLSFLDENPLPASYSIFVHSNYANTDSLQLIKTNLESLNMITDVSYPQDYVTILDANIQRIGYILLVIAILFILIAFTLIDSAIRLKIFSQRFTIKSMQLVGATSSFIRKPFLTRAIINGVISAVLAMVLLLALLQFISTLSGNLDFFSNQTRLGLVFGGMLVLGLLISITATTFAVNKYLNRKIEDLY